MRRRFATKAPRRLRFALAVVAVGVLALPAAASAATRHGKGHKKPTLTVGIIEAPLSLDPSSGAAGPYTPMLNLGYDHLIALSSTGALVPQLATSWKYLGKGNTKFELTLRHGVHFSNGQPLNGAAVVNWFKYCDKSPTLAFAFGTFKSIKAVGKYTVKFTLNAPNPEIPFELTANWGDVAAPAGVATPADLSGGKVGGAGPYEVVPSQTVIGSQYTYVPNKHYYDPSTIQYSKIVFKIIASSSSLLQAAETGEVEAAYGSTTTAAAAASAGLKVYSAQSGVNQLVLSDFSGKTEPALGNLKVRQALNYAINRAAIAKAIAGKYGTPISEPGIGRGYVPSLKDYYPYDPAKAKALLASAGYSKGFSFSAVSWVDPSVGSTVLLAVAKYLSAVGVTLHVYQPPTGPDYVSNTATCTTYTSKQFLTNIGGTGDSAIGDYADFLNPAINACKADDPTLDALNKKAGSAANPLHIEQQMVTQETKQALFLPVYTYDFLWYVGKHVGNFSISDGSPQPNIATWTPK